MADLVRYTFDNPGTLVRNIEPSILQGIIADELTLIGSVMANKPTPYQIMGITNLMLSHPDVAKLRMIELKAFMNGVKLFRYGKVYGTLGWDVICEWINKFAEERYRVIEEESYNRHMATKHDGNERISLAGNLLRKAAMGGGNVK